MRSTSSWTVENSFELLNLEKERRKRRSSNRNLAGQICRKNMRKCSKKEALKEEDSLVQQEADWL